MKIKFIYPLLTLSALVLLLSQCKREDSSLLSQRAREVFKPLPVDFFENGQRPSDDMIELGRSLFFESSISIDGKTSCSTCHPPENFGVDGLPVSLGNHGKKNPRNAPTVLNAAGQFVQHWRGDRRDVEDQAIRALTGKASFGAPSREFVEEKLKENSVYMAAFTKAFADDPDPVNVENFATAVGAFERTLVSRSRFDRFLEGDGTALTEEEKAGLETFIQSGCAGCHNGVLVGGNGFQKFGLVQGYAKFLYPDHSEKWDHPDQGRFDVTGEEGDRFVYKVPSLRNVSRTSPYFHDGSVTSLPEAVRIMGETQLGKSLTPTEVDRIVKFLSALEGAIPENYHRGL